MGEGREGQEVTGVWRKLRGDDGDQEDRKNSTISLGEKQRAFNASGKEDEEEAGGMPLVFPCGLGRSKWGALCVALLHLES